MKKLRSARNRCGRCVKKTTELVEDHEVFYLIMKLAIFKTENAEHHGN
jgi:bacterioferritin-associated ferredoxin